MFSCGWKGSPTNINKEYAMKKKIQVLAVLLGFALSIKAQSNEILSHLDQLMNQGSYKEAATVCFDGLKKDSLNAEIYFKQGSIYQNLLMNDKALQSFRRAVQLSPGNKQYLFTLAKIYHTNGKSAAAIPLFEQAYQADTMNFVRTYYLADAYYQRGYTDRALSLYQMMNKRDTTNTLVIDRMAACYLKKGWTRRSINAYRKSLELNEYGISAIKNLSYIYYKTNMPDSALVLLDKGIKADSTDVDLYSRRGDVYYGKTYYYRSQADYLRVLASGDTSAVMLKRIGIGLVANENHAKAEDYLLKSYLRDSTDAETCVVLAKCYLGLNQNDKKDFYFDKAVKQVSTFYKTLAGLYRTMGWAYFTKKQHKEASEYFKRSLEIDYDSDICRLLASTFYEYYLKDRANAIKYYTLFLEKPVTGKERKDERQIKETIERLKKEQN